MQQVRINIFETNSSSVHSLVIDKSGREPSKFKLNQHGKIEVSFGSFGSEYEIYNTQYSKLSYLMTCLYYIAGYDINAIYDNYQFHYIESTICDYTGATGITILEDIDPYLDHQSIPAYDISIINSWDKDEIIDFIFNKYVSLKTSCD